MHPVAGIALIALGTTVALVTGGWLRTTLPRPAIDVLMALAGALVGIGGLMTIEGVSTASWIAGPLALALVAPINVRALFAHGGPFRT